MFRTIFSDDAILVLDKPANLVVTKSDTQIKGTLEDILKSEFKINIERGGIVHRLDKDTSGLIVIAKTVEALASLQAQFKERTTKKEYLALVHGFMEKAGIVEGSIGRNPGNREKFTVLEEGKEAVTEYEPIDNFQFSIFNFQSIFNNLNKIQLRKLGRQHYGNFTLLKVKPKTGRTHQIRVHLKYLGFPIVSDEKYGGRKMVRLDKRWCPRQFLHAAKLEFDHPVSRERLSFESPLPDDLQKALDNLETTTNHER